MRKLEAHLAQTGSILSYNRWRHDLWHAALQWRAQVKKYSPAASTIVQHIAPFARVGRVSSVGRRDQGAELAAAARAVGNAAGADSAHAAVSDSSGVAHVPAGAGAGSISAVSSGGVGGAAHYALGLAAAAASLGAGAGAERAERESDAFDASAAPGAFGRALGEFLFLLPADISCESCSQFDLLPLTLPSRCR